MRSCLAYLTSFMAATALVRVCSAFDKRAPDSRRLVRCAGDVFPDCGVAVIVAACEVSSTSFFRFDACKVLLGLGLG